MPIYEYQCENCGGITDALRKISEADMQIQCEHCHSTNTRRTHSVFAAGSSESLVPGLPTGGGCRCGNPHGPCGL